MYIYIYMERKGVHVRMRVCAHIGSGVSPPGLNYSLSAVRLFVNYLTFQSLSFLLWKLE